MDSGLTSRQQQALRSKEKLQRIVLALSETRTLDDIRIRDICDAAGMSLGSFYQYFPSKENCLIYSYKTKDDDWEALGLQRIADPLERVCRVVATHLYSMTEHSLCFDTQLYISQLKEYDAYFFTSDRFLPRIVREAIAELQQAGLAATRLEAAEITRRVLDYSRGLVYNYCIAHKEDHPAWLAHATDCQKDFFSLFLTPEGLSALQSAPDRYWEPVKTPLP